ncbi:MAG: molecular chaperone DnaK [Deltaproteobacteria bacterium]|nr:molecular chaperone DnaK [Deltaproteobacteria bacterium]HCH62332.1 molecular chaperone DnaK [Deltaproteobacteria bacterium]
MGRCNTAIHPSGVVMSDAPIRSDGSLSASGRALLHARLVQEQGALHELVSDAGGRTGTVDLDPGREGRVSRVDALQHQQMAKAGRRRAEARLERVEAALERLLDDPEMFGWCPDCGEPIPWRRLDAVPESVLCVPCLQRRQSRR